jgi:shikimate kinase/3-dehydroquinate synthase
MTRISDPLPPVVVLAGFMGVGKTRVGQTLAGRLGVPFIDTDALIESKAGMTVAEIFERHGEARFRELETDVCHDLSAVEGAVIATGGGTLMDEKNFRRLSILGTMVLLYCTVDATLERVAAGGVRPMFGVAAAGDALTSGTLSEKELRDRIETLLDERRDVYDRIDFKIDTTGRSSDEVASEVVSSLITGCRVINVDVDVRPIPSHDGGEREPACQCRIVIGRGAASKLGPYLDELGLRSLAFLFMPKHLSATFLDRIRPSLDAVSIPHEVVPVADGDGNKNLAQVRDLLDRLASSGAGRDNPVVSIGGGVIGDVAGFVASTYMRGLPFVQVPTTLVSQVDASIGGKVGVNHPRAKNLIGALYQPLLVLDDPLMLESLPFEEISVGMGEVIKTAIIGSPDLYDYIGSVTDGPAGETLVDSQFLERCIFECARVKSAIVERDPFDQNVRRTLNLGHTLGHALESALEYEGIKHGAAVAIGTVAAIRVAVARGRADRSFLDKTIAMLAWCGLPTRPPPVDRDRLRSALKLDKKVKSGRLYFVLPLGAGRVEIIDDLTEDELLVVL